MFLTNNYFRRNANLGERQKKKTLYAQNVKNSKMFKTNTFDNCVIIQISLKRPNIVYLFNTYFVMFYIVNCYVLFINR